MTNEELKTALLSETPVVLESPTLGKVKYKRVSAIIYRAENGKITVSAELEDRLYKSVTVAEPRFVRKEAVE